MLYRFCAFIFPEQSVEDLSVGNVMPPRRGHVCPLIGHACPMSLLHAVLQVKIKIRKRIPLVMRYI